MVALLGLALSGCDGTGSGAGQGSVPEGTALAPGGDFWAELSEVPLGQQWVTMDATLHNTTDQPLEVLTVSVQGHGIGSVVDVSAGEIGPIDAQQG